MKDTKIPEAIMLCLSKGYTQIELARIVLPKVQQDQAEWYISRWKNGHRLGSVKKDQLNSICRIAGVDPNWVLDFDKCEHEHTSKGKCISCGLKIGT